MTILDQTIQHSVGLCIDKDGKWTRGTKALRGIGAFTERAETIGQIIHKLISHQEAPCKEFHGWLSPGSYAGPAYDKWAVDIATWREGPRDKDNKPKFARSQDHVTSAQIFAFDVDGDPYEDEQAAYVEATAVWAEAGRPAGQGPTKPDGRGITREQLRLLLIELKKTGYLFGIATTFNSSVKGAPGCFRLRIFFFADQPVTSLGDFRLARLPFLKFFDSIGIEIDSAPANWASVFYMPAFPAETDPGRVFGVYQAGELFDVEKNIAEGKTLAAAPVTVSPRKTSTGRTVVEARAQRGANLPADLEVILSNGTIIRALSLTEGQHLQCYSPWRSEKTPSAFLQECDGKVYFHDSAEKVTRWVDGFCDFYLGPPETHNISLSGVVEGPNHPMVDRVIALPGATPAKGQYLADQISLDGVEGLIFLAAPMGCGKTALLKKTLKGVSKWLYVGDTLALGRAVARDLGATMHDEIPAGKEFEYPHAYTCIHSIARFLYLVQEGGYTLVLDESPQLMAALHSSPMRGFGAQAADHLAALMARADRVVAASADVTDAHIASVVRLGRRYAPSLATTVVHRPVVRGSRSVALYGKKKWEADLEQDIRDHVSGGANLMVSLTSKKKVREWVLRARKLNPDVRVIGICADNAKEALTQALLADPERLQEEYDIIFFSPSVRTGVSFEGQVLRYYQSVTMAISATALAQTTMRCRNLLDPVIHTHIQQQTGCWDTNPERIRKVVCGTASATQEAILAADIHWSWCPSDWTRAPATPSDDWFLDSFLEMEIQKRTAKNDLVRAYLGAVARHGFILIDRRELKISEEMAEEIKANRTEAKDQARTEWSEAIARAPRLDEDEVEAIARQHSVEAPEAAAVEAYHMREFYGLDTLTPEFVISDRDGRARSEIKDYTMLTMYSKGIRQAAALMDRIETKGLQNHKRRELPEYSRWALKARLADALIRKVLGVGAHKLDGLQLTETALRAAMEPLVNDPKWRYAMQEIYGVACNAKTLESPVRWFLNFLRRFGVTSTSVRPRPNRANRGQKRERVYTLDTSTVQGLSRHNYRKVLGMVLDARREPMAPTFSADGVCSITEWMATLAA